MKRCAQQEENVWVYLKGVRPGVDKGQDHQREIGGGICGVQKDEKHAGKVKAQCGGEEWGGTKSVARKKEGRCMVRLDQLSLGARSLGSVWTDQGGGKAIQESSSVNRGRGRDIRDGLGEGNWERKMGHCSILQGVVGHFPDV